MQPGKKSILREQLRAPRVLPDEVNRLCDVPEDIGDLIDDEKLESLQKHFSRFDVDQCGYIDIVNLTALLRGMGFNPTDKRISEILRAYDTDRNGNLTFGEFVEVWAYYCQEAKSEGEVISRAFTFFLPNDCQSMSYSDFKEVMTDLGAPLTPEEVDRFFALVDDESDGILRLDEFMKECSHFVHVLYSNQSDLTTINGSLEQDGIQPLFLKSVRPQRRSLMQSNRMQDGKGQALSIFQLVPLGGIADSWLHKTSARRPGVNETEQSPSRDRSQGSRYHRRSRFSRYSRCVHVESPSAEQSVRSGSRHSSPVRYLRSGATGPWHPNALAASLDACSIQKPVEVAQHPQEEAQPRGGEAPSQNPAHHIQANRAARVTWCAHHPSSEVVDANNPTLVLSPRRRTMPELDGSDTRRCNELGFGPTERSSKPVDGQGASVETNRGEGGGEVWPSLPRPDGQDQVMS